MSVENIKTDKELKGAYLTGERPLFHGKKLHIEQTIFNDGESPLKESRDIVLENSSFQWKYPLWYSKNIEARDCTWLEMARSGVVCDPWDLGYHCPGKDISFIVVKNFFCSLLFKFFHTDLDIPHRDMVHNLQSVRKISIHA